MLGDERRELCRVPVVSAVGYVAFAYGRRQRRLPQLAAGLTLMVFPYFAASVQVTLAIGAALLLAIWLLLKLGW